MFKIQGIDHIVLRSMNTEKMLSFYVDILGCTIERVNTTIGLTHLRIGDNLIDLLEIEHPVTDKNLEHFCLRISPFDYDMLKLYFEKHSIELLRYGNRYSSLGHRNSFYLKDPDGNELEFVEGEMCD
jgi:glyoxylase I family protein